MRQKLTVDDTQWDEGLTARQRQFVVFYCTDEECFMNGRNAYIKAFTKYKAGEVIYTPEETVADAGASRLLSNVKVKDGCRQLMKMLQPDIDTDNAAHLLHDLALQAFYNPADIIDANGQLIVKNLKDLGDLAKCISNISLTKYGVKVTLSDRSRAQERLYEYLSLVRELPERDVSLPVVFIKDKQGIEEWNEANDTTKN